MKYRISIRVKRGLKCPVPIPWIRKVVQKALHSEGIRHRVEIGVFFTDDKEIRKLNKRYRSHDQVTDVLSFALHHTCNAFNFMCPAYTQNHIQLGEIIISLPRAIVQAHEHNCSVQHELALLLIHGTLHLLNYDHEIAKDAHLMEEKERLLLKSII